MPGDTTHYLHDLVGRVQRGDPAARRALLDAACGRLRRLAAHILSGSFRDLAGRHDLDSIVHDTWLRLAQALESARPESVEHFFRLAAQKVRHVLLDLVERKGRDHDSLHTADGSEPGAVGGRTLDPAKLAEWTEFHRRAAALPDDERAVFEMHYYLDLPQAEVAAALGLHPKKVSRLWLAATDKLADGVAEHDPTP
ncbi:MAG: sigma-70 family RNA polymerase sigma factor [Gemmataceae bacterium]|nr:sigma-70 family RNA polymerase sigma factor [Gemmataceae bacterium]